MDEEVYKVKDPDGNIREIKGPAGASDDEIISQAKSLFGGAVGDTAAAIAPTPSEPINERRRASQSLPRSLAFGTGFPRATGDLGSLSDLDKGAYAAGGQVTDLTGSPLLGTAVRMIPDAASMLIGGGIGSRAAPAMESAAKGLMNSALKPTLEAHMSGKAATAVDTLLEKGINATSGGVDKLKTQIENINNQVASMLQGSGATVDKGQIASRLQDVVGRIERTNATPQDAIKDVEKVYTQFIQNKIIPDKIPVEQAQELKKGIYQMLRKKYGELGSDTVEAQKALARGMKEEISAAVPEVAGLNAEQSRLITTLNVAERRALMDLNKNPGGLAILTHSPMTFAAYMADKSALFKSLAARLINAQKTTIPTAAGAAVGGGAAETLKP